MVERSLSLLILECEELYGAAVGEGGSEVADLAIDFCGKAVKATEKALVNGYAQDSGVVGQEVRIVRGI